MNKKFMWLNKAAFTMAEILLSLTIIGIVAAITLPSLTANFQDKAFNAKRQALHARLSNALRTMDVSEYLPFCKKIYENQTGDEKYPNIDNFLDDLGKSLSIKIISDEDSIFSNSGDDWYGVIGYQGYFPFSGALNNKYFQTVNGESIGILFNGYDMYNSSDNYFGILSDKKQPNLSLLFLLVYDLNGRKGPNKFGKDMGVMGAFYYDNVELYAPMLGAITDNMFNEDCDPSDSSCQRYKYPDYRLATPEELVVLYGLMGRYSGFGEVNLNTPICAIDGHKYAFNYEYIDWYYREDNSDCIYMLVTNDGSAPKNGVIYDINSEIPQSNLGSWAD